MLLGGFSTFCLDKLLTSHYIDVILRNKSQAQGGSDAGILCKVQKKGRDQESKVYQNEKQASRDSRRMPEMWDQGISNRQIGPAILK